MIVGDLLPHFDVTDSHGRRVGYGERIWQKRALVLLTLPHAARAGEDPYVAALLALEPELALTDAVCVITRDVVGGLSPYGLAIADRWGELALVRRADAVGGLPTADDILD